MFAPQTSYIHPRIDGETIRYFEWMGAAHYTADRRAGAMHGKVFLLDSIYAGIDEKYVYGRLDFAELAAQGEFDIVVNLESWAENAMRARRALRLDVAVHGSRIREWKLSQDSEGLRPEDAAVVLGRTFEFKIPLSLLYAAPLKSSSPESPAASKIRLRFSVWQNRLPIDALPVEGWMELKLLPENDLAALER